MEKLTETWTCPACSEPHNLTDKPPKLEYKGGPSMDIYACGSFLTALEREIIAGIPEDEKVARNAHVVVTCTRCGCEVNRRPMDWTDEDEHKFEVVTAHHRRILDAYLAGATGTPKPSGYVGPYGDAPVRD